MLEDGSFYAFLTDYAVLLRLVIMVSLLILAKWVFRPRRSACHPSGPHCARPQDRWLAQGFVRPLQDLAAGRSAVRAGCRRCAQRIAPTWNEIGQLAAFAAIRTFLN